MQSLHITLLTDLWRCRSRPVGRLTVKEANIFPGLAKCDALVPIAGHASIPLEALIPEDKAGGEGEYN